MAGAVFKTVERSFGLLVDSTSTGSRQHSENEILEEKSTQLCLTRIMRVSPRSWKFASTVIFFALTFAVVAQSAERAVSTRSATACCSTANTLPATQLGSISLAGGAVNLIVKGTTGYACGPNAINVIDISNPAAPRLLSPFGSSDLNGNAIVGCIQVGQSLVVPVNTQSAFVYDISASPNIKSQAQFTPAFPQTGAVSFLGNVGWFTTLASPTRPARTRS